MRVCRTVFFFLMILALSATGYVQAQQIAFDHFDRRRGLADNNINSISSDSRGFLWLATKSGLSRFNGKSFRNYNQLHGLIPGEVTSVLALSPVNIWIGLENGAIMRFDGSSFDTIAKASEGKYPKFNIDDDKQLWISTDGEGARCVLNPFEKSKQKLQIVQYDYKRGLATSVYQVATGPDRRNYFVTESGIKVNSPGTEDFLTFKPEGFPIMGYYCMISDSNGLWFGGQRGLVFVEWNGQQFGRTIFYQMPGLTDVTSLSHDGKGRIWAGTWGSSVFIFNNGNWRRITEKNGLKGNKISAIFNDREGNIWIASFNSGLSGYKGSVFTSIQEIGNVPIRSVHTLVYDPFRSTLFAGTDEGIIEIKHKDHSLVAQRLPDSEKFRIFSIAHWYDEFYVLGTFGQGMVVYDVNKRKVSKRIRFDNDDENFITSLKFIGPDELVAGHIMGAFKYHLTSREKKVIHEISDKDVLSIARGQGDTVFIGTKRQGLFLYTSNGCRNLERDFPELKGHAFNTISIDKRGVLIGTADGNLFYLNIRKNTCEQLEYPNPLQGEFGFVHSEGSDIWVGTGNGIAHLDSQFQNIRYFDINTGMVPVDLKYGACSWAFDSLLAFGTADGIWFLDSKQNEGNLPLPELTLLSGLVNDSLRINDGSHLNHKQNRIQFRFNSVSLTYPYSLKTEYRLIPVSEEWTNAGNDSLISFAALLPGQYNFELRASLQDDPSTKVIRQVSFVINPPFQQTVWFYLLMIILFIAITYFIYRIALRITLERRLRAYASQLKMSELEMKSLRSQMNPHFIFNSLQSIQNYLNDNQSDQANEYLLKFSRLMRLILENSLHDTVALEDDLKALELYLQLESIRLPYPFSHQIKIGEDIDPESVMIPPLLIQPFVENAIWHGLQPKNSEGAIEIIFSIQNNLLNCAIADNGVGRSAGKSNGNTLKKKSLGVNITRERLTLLSARLGVASDLQFVDLFDHENNPAGTRVELLIPLIYD